MELIEDAECLASHAGCGIGTPELGKEQDRAGRSVDDVLPFANGLLMATLGLKGVRQHPAYDRIVGIDFKSAAALIDAAVPVAEHPKHRFVTHIGYWRWGIQLERSSVFGESFLQPAHADEAVTVPHVREGIIRIEGYRALKLVLGSRAIVIVEQGGPSQRRVRLARPLKVQPPARQDFCL